MAGRPTIFSFFARIFPVNPVAFLVVLVDGLPRAFSCTTERSDSPIPSLLLHEPAVGSGATTGRTPRTAGAAGPPGLVRGGGGGGLRAGGGGGVIWASIGVAATVPALPRHKASGPILSRCWRPKL